LDGKSEKENRRAMKYSAEILHLTAMRNLMVVSFDFARGLQQAAIRTSEGFTERQHKRNN
jgi:hypothetical protein